MSSKHQKLGKYRLLAELGKGGFATVYRAEDTTLGREVALKILDPLLMRDTTWVDRFRKEARTVAVLDHPRIVPIYEIAEADDRLFIAMKLIDGPSLDKALAARGPLPWQEAERITREVAAVLSYAHDKGLLHRDLKPGNILLHPERGALLTDFGFARMVSESSMSVSLSGGIVGTPHYLAPEIWHNQPATPATDLYALGCMLYEMALGRKAFPGDTSPAIMTAHLLQPLDLPEAWPEGVPAGLSDVLQKALAREPEARFGQVAALVAALDALAVDPLAEPYAALEAAVAGEQWDAALRLAEDIRAQAPDYRDVETLLQQAQAGQERAQREQLAEQWKAQAHAALEAGQYEVTRAAAERWLQLLPEDKAAKALLARANAELQSEDAPGVVSDQGKAHSGGIRQTPPRSEQQPADQRNMPLWVWGAIGAVVLALVVGLGALFNSMNAEPTDVPPVEEVSASSTPTETPRSPTNTPSPTAASTSTSTPTRTPMPTSTPTVQPTLYPVATRVRGIDGMTMVYVPAGEFEMGSTEEQFQEVVDQCVNAGNDRDDCERWYGDEQPVHTVTLDAFWLDQTEVSVAQFRQFVNATDYETTVEERGSSFAFTDDGWGVVEGADWAHPQGPGSRAEDDHPVVHVSWHDAEAYCAWAGGRLPTEAEWEYAARGPESFAYPWGDDFDCAKGNFATDCGSDDYDHTSPVGSFLEGASWVNAYDLSGNVWEWVADWYAEDYYAQSPRENPTGPTSGDYRVLRGGSWFLNERHVRGANRDRNVPPATFVFGGFRCVAVAAPGE